MVTHKNKSRGKSSNNYHRSPVASAKSAETARKTIFSVIIIAIFVVVISAIVLLFANDETRVKSNISKLASDYYENYFYVNLTSSPKFKDLDSTMSKYQEHGFAPISLNELLLYGNQKNEDYSDFLTKYCDRNQTYIKFYPDSPYTKESYHTEYSYSCNF